MRGFQTNSFWTTCLVCFPIIVSFIFPQFVAWIPSAPAVSEKPAETSSDFLNFVKSVRNGQADVVRGVYVANAFALPIVQQPPNNAIYVSNKRREITQFAQAAKNDVLGLLAHNYLSGKLFYQLVPDEEVIIVYGDGATQRYRITTIQQYQKLAPKTLRSDFVDLHSRQRLTSAQVFDQFYRGDHRLIFQTCLAEDGLLNWGVTFIVAVPMENNSLKF